MVATSFENKVTMGNLLTVVAMLAAIIAGYSRLQVRQDQQADIIATIVADVTQAEGRIRAVEQANATSGARYESLSQAVGEMKAEIRQTNDLLRRLLEGDSR